MDILGAVYDYVRAYGWANGPAPQLSEDVIVRGWQNTGTLPPGTAEFCVLTLKSSVTHGKPVNLPLKDCYEYSDQLWKIVEHSVQIDFCSAEPFTDTQMSKLRADLLETVSFSYRGPQFFQAISPDLTMLYAEGVQDMSFLDPDKLYTARYMLTLHLAERQHTNFFLTPSFNRVNVRNGFNAVENVDAHHHETED